MTEPQRRMLRYLAENGAKERNTVFHATKSWSSGFRVVAKLVERGEITSTPTYDGAVWLKITDAGRAALAPTASTPSR
jgi:DNA-binding MarR family transcriptional regulator